LWKIRAEVFSSRRLMASSGAARIKASAGGGEENTGTGRSNFDGNGKGSGSIAAGVEGQGRYGASDGRGLMRGQYDDERSKGARHAAFRGGRMTKGKGEGAETAFRS